MLLNLYLEKMCIESGGATFLVKEYRMFMFWWKLALNTLMIAIGGKIWFMILNLQLVLSSALHQDLEQFESLESWKYLHCFKLAILFSTSENQNRAVMEAHRVRKGKNKWQSVKMKWGVWQNSINWLLLFPQDKGFRIFLYFQQYRLFNCYWFAHIMFSPITRTIT